MQLGYYCRKKIGGLSVVRGKTSKLLIRSVVKISLAFKFTFGYCLWYVIL